MSNYKTKAKKPKSHRTTEEFEDVDMLDDFFGKHQYAVRFPDDSYFRREECEFNN